MSRFPQTVSKIRYNPVSFGHLLPFYTGTGFVKGNPFKSRISRVISWLGSKKIFDSLFNRHRNFVYSRLDKYGLCFDDYSWTTPVKQATMERIPAAEKKAHLKRVTRAFDVKMKHEHVPKELLDANRNHLWLSPYMVGVDQECQEMESYDRMNKFYTQ
eukprot:TRINITY_DN557_c0_g1_i1.p1 TRINITY_DN557_c0_g1~~TRINITY_DN557_c0_g1_i1.p1  ORF type:complete len:158 (+),score=51.30 TRINITY_DN557_c0_g1_i1:67-540(+)